MADTTQIMAYGEDRKPIIDAAIQHLTTTDPDTVRTQLADQNMHEHLKQDPTGLTDLLRTVRADSPTGQRFSAWKAAQKVMQAAGRDPHM